MLALQGFKILDLSGGFPPAFGTQILADHGAEVINIEGRRLGEDQQTDTENKKRIREAAYSAINRNKESIGLNLKDEDARQIFYRLAAGADVIVDPFRPGVTKRLGIDYPTISQINPKIIYCGITGYGQNGPYAGFPGHDPNYIGLAGALNYIGEVDGPPIAPLNLLGDMAGAGLQTALAILIALMAREKTGKGQFIDLSYTDGVVSLLTVVASRYFQSGNLPQRGGYPIPGYPGTAFYKTSDGKYITLACLESRFWENLCREMDREEYIPYVGERMRQSDPADNQKWEEITTFFQERFLSKTRDEWFDLLSQKDIPIGKVNTLEEAFSDPQILHRQMVLELEHPTEGKVKQVGIPIKLSETPGRIQHMAPLPGEHTTEILKKLGYNETRIEQLRKKGVVM